MWRTLRARRMAGVWILTTIELLPVEAILVVAFGLDLAAFSLDGANDDREEARDGAS